MSIVTMSHHLPASSAQPSLANFDAVQPHERDLVALKESVTTLKAIIASPVPVFGRVRRFLAGTLRLPVRPSAQELELRELISTFIRSYDSHVAALDPSSHTN